jgi:periplasmic protein TonB
MHFNLLPFISLLLPGATTQGQQPPTTGTSSVNLAAPVTNPIVKKVEIDARFPGPADAWATYLGRHLRADVPVKKNAPAGVYRVVVRFLIDKDGSLTNITPETNHGFGMEAELVRIIKKSPRWIPASQDGQKVRAYRRQPITFTVSEK